jgi:hypothetical protein
MVRPRVHCIPANGVLPALSTGWRGAIAHTSSTGVRLLRAPGTGTIQTTFDSEGVPTARRHRPRVELIAVDQKLSPAVSACARPLSADRTTSWKMAPPPPDRHHDRPRPPPRRAPVRRIHLAPGCCVSGHGHGHAVRLRHGAPYDEGGLSDALSSTSSLKRPAIPPYLAPSPERRTCR